MVKPRTQDTSMDMAQDTWCVLVLLPTVPVSSTLISSLMHSFRSPSLCSLLVVVIRSSFDWPGLNHVTSTDVKS